MNIIILKNKTADSIIHDEVLFIIIIIGYLITTLDNLPLFFLIIIIIYNTNILAVAYLRRETQNPGVVNNREQTHTCTHKNAHHPIPRPCVRDEGEEKRTSLI